VTEALLIIVQGNLPMWSFTFMHVTPTPIKKSSWYWHMRQRLSCRES